jgi:sulfite exporter TauE/SafE
MSWLSLSPAFLLGLLGSLHCVGMCGPLVLMLPVQHQNPYRRAFGALLYVLGKAFTYAAFGVFFGLIGQSFVAFGYQQLLSIVIGCLMLIAGFLALANLKFSLIETKLNVPLAAVRQLLSKWMQKENISSLLIFGLLNGLLPCGLVYTAAAASIETGSTFNAALYMFLFGIGTLPMMWSIIFFGASIQAKFRSQMKRIVPITLLLMGALLLVRGLGIGIPYLSPKINIEKKHMDCCQPDE